MKVVSDEISSLEGVDKRAEELLVKVARLNQALANIRVWAQDDQETERKITVREDDGKVLMLSVERVQTGAKSTLQGADSKVVKRGEMWRRQNEKEMIFPT